MEMIKAIEVAYNVTIGKARRGYFYCKRNGIRVKCSKDYPNLFSLQAALKQEEQDVK